VDKIQATLYRLVVRSASAWKILCVFPDVQNFARRIASAPVHNATYDRPDPEDSRRFSMSATQGAPRFVESAGVQDDVGLSRKVAAAALEFVERDGDSVQHRDGLVSTGGIV
jgi:hypothetical protein